MHPQFITDPFKNGGCACVLVQTASLNLRMVIFLEQV